MIIVIGIQLVITLAFTLPCNTVSIRLPRDFQKSNFLQFKTKFFNFRVAAILKGKLDFIVTTPSPTFTVVTLVKPLF